MVRFEVAADVQIGQSLAVLYLGVVDLLRNSELEQADHDQKVRAAEIQTIQDALAAGAAAADTGHALHHQRHVPVGGPAARQEGSNEVQAQSIHRCPALHVVTDAAAPERISPLILAATPTPDEPAVAASLAEQPTDRFRQPGGGCPAVEKTNTADRFRAGVAGRS